MLAVVLQVGSKLSRILLTSNSYFEGIQPMRRDEYILPCESLNGLGTPFKHNGYGYDHVQWSDQTGLRGFVMRVQMGKVLDYFRPISPASLCEMLTSHNQHEWSPTYVGVPLTPGTV